ncbi:MAG: hypothetical protein ACUVQ1_03470 [Candidatus Kapaibacteriales bacterium]
MKNFFKELNIKGLIFAVIVSFSIWIYSILNSEYVTFIKVPLVIQVPPKWSLAGRIPDQIDAQISATGWQILNLSYFPKSSYCVVQITEEAISQDKKILLAKDDLLKSLVLSASAKVIDVKPSNILIDIGPLTEKVVPIEFRGEINPRENFTIVGRPILYPDAIKIRGRSEVLDKIEYWPTQYVVFNDVYHSFQTEISLLDTLHSLISLSREKVNLIVSVDLNCEQEVYDVPIKIEEGTLPLHHTIEPQLVTVIVRSGVNRLSEVDLSTIEAKVNYFDLVNDTLGIIVPKVKLPLGVELLQIKPPFLYHWRTHRIQGELTNVNISSW